MTMAGIDDPIPIDEFFAIEYTENDEILLEAELDSQKIDIKNDKSIQIEQIEKKSEDDSLMSSVTENKESVRISRDMFEQTLDSISKYFSENDSLDPHLYKLEKSIMTYKFTALKLKSIKMNLLEYSFKPRKQENK